jgi:hypothetical protein
VNLLLGRSHQLAAVRAFVDGDDLCGADVHHLAVAAVGTREERAWRSAVVMIGHTWFVAVRHPGTSALEHQRTNVLTIRQSVSCFEKSNVHSRDAS